MCKRESGQPRTPTALSAPLRNVKLGSLGKPFLPGLLVFARGDKGTHADIRGHEHVEKEEGRKNVRCKPHHLKPGWLSSSSKVLPTPSTVQQPTWWASDLPKSLNTSPPFIFVLNVSVLLWWLVLATCPRHYTGVAFALGDKSVMKVSSAVSLFPL